MSKSIRETASNNNPAFDIPLRKARGNIDVRVTPEIAQHWLGFNTSNREIVQARLQQFQGDMERGEWHDQGDNIRFAYGKLLDGQHRLIALTVTGVTLTMSVAYGLNPETQANMDTGRGRTPRDVLTIESMGPWEAGTFGSAVHTILSYQSGMALYSAKKFLNREIRNFYLEHRSSVEATVQFCKQLPRKHPLLPHARIMALHYIFSRIDADLTDKFFSQLFAGEGLAQQSPTATLRNRLMSDLLDKKKRSTYEHMWFMVKTWNMVRRGSTARNSVFFYVKNGEQFPEITQ